MNEYSLTVFLFMVPREKKDNAYANFFFGGGGGGERGAGQTRFIVGDVQMANFV